MDRHFFEGAEKKVELVLSDGGPSLRSLGRDYWQRVVEAANAQILSCISSKECDAYLLSESSLFVFDRKLLMITCGATRLIDAIALMLQSIPPEQIEFFVFERKNEVLPHAQSSGFHEDARALGHLLPGEAYRFGHEDEHHVYLYHHGNDFEGVGDDITLELLMYGLPASVAELFDRRAGTAAIDARRAEKLRELLPQVEIDEHLFEPSGYSLNGLRGEQYTTIHVTPQRYGSYASFETNDLPGRDRSALVQSVLDLFKPRAFDLVLFDHAAQTIQIADGYMQRAHVLSQLASGYHLRFASYSRPSEAVEEPFRLSSTALIEQTEER
jgi:S-adenosylmethionine decarboxylase